MFFIGGTIPGEHELAILKMLRRHRDVADFPHHHASVGVAR